MKKAATFISRSIGVLFAYLIPLVLFKITTRVFNMMRSGYISKKFKRCGSNFSIDYPFYHIGLKHVEVGSNFRSFAGLRLEAIDLHLGCKFNPDVIIGNNVSINTDCHIACINKVVIGNNVLMASRIFITDHFHGSIDRQSLTLPPSERKIQSRGPVIIEDNVWIGEGVAIMPGITIGTNCIIGANAVVTKSFPANSVIGGNPAKIIKTIQ